MSQAVDDPLHGGLIVTARGPATDGGRLALSELARIASSFQATLERIALSIIGGRRSKGRRPQEISDAVRMDFVGFREGSAVLALQRTPSAASDDLLADSFRALTRGLAIIEEDVIAPNHFTPAVINGLVTLCGGINRRNLHTIEFSTGSKVHFRIDQQLQSKLKRIQKASLQREITIVGRLHMGDFDPLSLRCRIDTHNASISCDVDDELKEPVFYLLGELVMATGTAELQADGVTVRVLHLERLETVATSKTPSLDDLAREQNVSPVGSLADFRGEDIDDFDEFLNIVRSTRG